MQPKPAKDDRAHLHDMLDSARKAASYVQGQTFEQFWDDFKTRDAVAMRLTVIGEAAGQVSAATVAKISAVPFHQIRGMRHRIAHSYDRVDFREVWKVTQHDLKPLISELEKYLLQERQRQQQAETPRLRQSAVRPPRPGEGRGPRMGF